jgi:hypothetical protein
MTDQLRQAAQQALEALDDDRYLYKYSHVIAAITALRKALEQPEQEPVAWMSVSGSVASDHEKKMGYVLDGMFTIPLYTTPPAAQWDKPAASFNDWWDSYHIDPANPFVEGTAAYWAWSGWKAAQPEQVDCPRCGHVCSQRKWVGLTDEEVAIASAEFDTRLKLAFHSGMYKAQIILRKKNDSTY